MTRPLIEAWIRDRSPDLRKHIHDDTKRFLRENHRICRRIATAFLAASRDFSPLALLKGYWSFPF
ncbi:MAG: hypothetical protein LUQ13_04435 [Methanomicrobiales archaeon]|nr:hypothetical protein [Methanomicrobiales archaeon]